MTRIREEEDNRNVRLHTVCQEDRTATINKTKLHQFTTFRSTDYFVTRNISLGARCIRSTAPAIVSPLTSVLAKLSQHSADT